jgi:hypothetical protein
MHRRNEVHAKSRLVIPALAGVHEFHVQLHQRAWPDL